MENKLNKLKIKLEQLIKNSNCSIEEILEISNKIDKEIEKTYFINNI